MVNYHASLDRTFAALADPIRRAILARLAGGVCCVTELAAPFDVSLPAISKHLRVLERAGLLVRTKDGRVHRCCLAGNPLKDAAEWLSGYHRFWEKKLDALASYLETVEKETSSWPSSRVRKTQRSLSPAPSTRNGKRSSRPGRTLKR